MRWAVSARIINGISDGVLDPADSATRAHAACLTQRFLTGSK